MYTKSFDNINELANDIMKGIFQYLMLNELLSARRVCKKWYQLLTNNTLKRIECKLTHIVHSNSLTESFKKAYMQFGKEIIKHYLFSAAPAKQKFEGIINEILSMRYIPDVENDQQASKNSTQSSDHLLTFFFEDKKETLKNLFSLHLNNHTELQPLLKSLYILINSTIVNYETAELVADAQVVKEKSAGFMMHISAIQSHMRLASVNILFDLLEAVISDPVVLAPSPPSEANYDILEFVDDARLKVGGLRSRVLCFDVIRKYVGPGCILGGIGVAAFDLRLWITNWQNDTVGKNLDLEVVLSLIAIFLLFIGVHFTVSRNKSARDADNLLNKASQVAFFRPQKMKQKLLDDETSLLIEEKNTLELKIPATNQVLAAQTV